MFGGGVDTLKTTLTDVQTKVNAVEGSVENIDTEKCSVFKFVPWNTKNPKLSNSFKDIINIEGKGKLYHFVPETSDSTLEMIITIDGLQYKFTDYIPQYNRAGSGVISLSYYIGSDSSEYTFVFGGIHKGSSYLFPTKENIGDYERTMLFSKNGIRFEKSLRVQLRIQESGSEYAYCPYAYSLD